MSVLREFTIATIKSNLREKQTLFWVFIFPLIIFLISASSSPGARRRPASLCT